MEDSDFVCAVCGQSFPSLAEVDAHGAHCQDNCEDGGFEDDPYDQNYEPRRNLQTPPSFPHFGEGSREGGEEEGQGNGETPGGGNSSETTAWDREETLLLLELYKQRQNAFNDPRVLKKGLWEQITNCMHDKGHTRFRINQVEGRWKTLVSAFRKIKVSRMSGKCTKRQFEFEAEFDELLQGGKTLPTRRPFSLPITPLIAQGTEASQPTAMVMTPMLNGEPMTDVLTGTDNADSSTDADVSRGADTSNMCADGDPLYLGSELQTFNWGQTETMMLIQLYKERHAEFLNPAVKRKTLWQDITSQIQRKGYPYSAHQVEGRWKTLTTTYRRGKRNFFYKPFLDGLIGPKQGEERNFNTPTPPNLSGENNESQSLDGQPGQDQLSNAPWSNDASQVVGDQPWTSVQPKVEMDVDGDNVMANSFGSQNPLPAWSNGAIPAQSLPGSQALSLNANQVNQTSSGQVPLPRSLPGEVSLETRIASLMSWKTEDTLKLIALYKNYTHRFQQSSAAYQDMWMELTRELHASGCMRTYEQVISQWRTLVSAFHQSRELRSLGHAVPIFPFESQMADALQTSSRENMEPVQGSEATHNHPVSGDKDPSENGYCSPGSLCAVYGSSRPSCVVAAQPAQCSCPCRCGARRTRGLKRKRDGEDGLSQVAELLQEYMERLDQREEERMKTLRKMHQEKMATLQNVIAVLRDMR